MSKHRYSDRAELSKAVTTPEGFLRARVTLSRVGVFDYGSYKALRRDSQVFDAESMASFELVPVVDGHPSENEGTVDATNARRLSVGSVGHVHRDGNLLVGQILITDADTIKKIKAGRVAVSAGYFANRVTAPEGARIRDPVTDEDSVYHEEQTDIRANHLALVDVARAGPLAKVHLDSFEFDMAAISVPSYTEVNLNPLTEGLDTMEKLVIDGIPFEVTPTVSAAISKERATSASLLNASSETNKELTSKLDKTQAIADAAGVEVAALKAKIAQLEDPKSVQAQVDARLAVQSLAAKHGLTSDGKDLPAVQREVCGKLSPELKLDGKSNDYVQAMFDALTSLEIKGNPVTDAAAKAVVADAKTPSNDSADSLREKFNKSFLTSSTSNKKE